MNNKNQVYKVWLVFEESDTPNTTDIKYYVINSKERKFQSSWSKLGQASEVCKDLNSMLKRQEFIKRTQKLK